MNTALSFVLVRSRETDELLLSSLANKSTGARERGRESAAARRNPQTPDNKQGAKRRAKYFAACRDYFRERSILLTPTRPPGRAFAGTTLNLRRAAWLNSALDRSRYRECTRSTTLPAERRAREFICRKERARRPRSRADRSIDRSRPSSVRPDSN